MRGYYCSNRRSRVRPNTAVGQAPRVPTMPELLAQFRSLDAQIQQTDREIAARRRSVHPGGTKPSAEWDELQAQFVNKHWRPFVAFWERGVKDIREYEAGTRSPASLPLIELLYKAQNAFLNQKSRTAGAAMKALTPEMIRALRTAEQNRGLIIRAGSTVNRAGRVKQIFASTISSLIRRGLLERSYGSEGGVGGRLTSEGRAALADPIEDAP